MDNFDKQIARLKKLLESFPEQPGHCRYGAMLLIANPGDVAFLAPLFPECRGTEIVSADDKGYDIWDDGRIIETDLASDEVQAWLDQRIGTRTDDEVKANLAQWAEDTFSFYRIPRKDSN